MDFPDVIPKKDEHSWATWVPGRRPEFKVHSRESLAHSALGDKGFYQSKAKYHLEGGQWVKKYEYQPPEECSCGNNYLEAIENAPPHMRPRKYFDDPDHDGPRWKMVPVCYECYSTGTLKKRQAEEEKRERAQLAALQAKYN